MYGEGEHGFSFSYGPPVPVRPRMTRPVSEHLAEVSRWIGEAGDSHGMGLAHSVPIARSFCAEDLELTCQALRRELEIGDRPSAKFTRQADKKNYRDSVSDPQIPVIGLFTRLRFLNGTPYEEFVFVSARDNRIVLVERRKPARGKPTGRLLAAHLIVSVEPDGALRNGRLSPSILKRIDRSEDMSEPAHE